MGSPKLDLGVGEPVPIYPTGETGNGQVQDQQKVLLQELIALVNDFFEGDLPPGDKLIHVNNAIKGKLMESEVLIEQAQSNSKKQFANSPDLANEMLNAIKDALAAQDTMSKQALDSKKLRGKMPAALLGPGQLYEALRARGATSPDQRV